MNQLVLREANKAQFLSFIEGLDTETPMQFSWKPAKSQRSVEQNGLMWSWLSVMAGYFSTEQRGFTRDDMHDLMRHKFLGYVEKKVGNTEMPPQLRSTTTLDVAEMHDYLTQIDAWAAACGCLLPRTADSVYDLMIQEQAA